MPKVFGAFSFQTSVRRSSLSGVGGGEGFFVSTHHKRNLNISCSSFFAVVFDAFPSAASERFFSPALQRMIVSFLRWLLLAHILNAKRRLLFVRNKTNDFKRMIKRK